MAAITASAATVSVSRAILTCKSVARVSSPLLMRMKGGRVTCSSEKANNVVAPTGIGAAAALVVATMSMSNPAFALVDERMSTEGTGLSLGLSNNLLGWILLGVFALVWSLYTVYTSTLEEDEESGLSL